MSNELRTLDQATIAKLVLKGDMNGLTDAQKVDYYSYRCQQAGLDPAAKPFDILTLNGKMILYANAACTQQLTSNRKLSHQVTNRELVDGIYCVFVRVTDTDGRSTENMGAVPIESLKGEAKANAMLKATTKAIRRAVLAHCGLGMMDETETETIPGAKMEPANTLANPTLRDAALSNPGPYAHPWSVDELEEFELTKDRAYAAFKAAGKTVDDFNAFAEKWKKNQMVDPAEMVLTRFAAIVGKLEEASKKKASE